MNEMLANQLFMARKYSDALPLLEKTIADNPNHKGAKRKLIICYAQTGEIRKSAVLFDSLIQEDIQFIIDADPINDDCPCPEIIEKVDHTIKVAEKDLNSIIQLAILMLYCDAEKSLTLFDQAQNMAPNDELVKHIFNTIQNHNLTALN